MKLCKPSLGNCPLIVVGVGAVCCKYPHALDARQSEAMLSQEVSQHGVLLETATKGNIHHQHAISIGLHLVQALGSLSQKLQGSQEGSTDGGCLGWDALDFCEFNHLLQLPGATRTLQLHQVPRPNTFRHLKVQNGAIWQLLFQRLPCRRPGRHQESKVVWFAEDTPVTIRALYCQGRVTSGQATGQLLRKLAILQRNAQDTSLLTTHRH
mmetsp:Transcript_70065/g.154465  ORF Transcript_70065/g.154465 Transcript_70065/m.154465 type:complete len:210 (+) Transcript_70065:494-1123(+)